MSLIKYASKEVICKIVYYGPGMSGKTTNLKNLFNRIPKKRKGEMISLATKQDRTLYFDFLPVDLGDIYGFTTKFQVYTVPGQVYYNATRKLVLQGTDGVVFVADSQRWRKEDNILSMLNLDENLKGNGFNIKTMPFVIQYNKRDLSDIMEVEELRDDINLLGVPEIPSSAINGEGTIETFKIIGSKVISNLRKKFKR